MQRSAALVLLAIFNGISVCLAVSTGDVFKTESILTASLSDLIKACSADPKTTLFGEKEKLSYISCYDFDLAAPRWTAHILFSDRAKNLDRADLNRWKVPESIKNRQASDNHPNGDKLEGSIGLKWDRGHLVPNNDMPEGKSKLSTLNVVNRAPQLQGVNRGVWKCSEVAIRRLNNHLKNTLVVVTFLDYGKAPFATVLEQRKGAQIAIPVSYNKIIYVAPVSKAKKSIRNFKSAACLSVSNRDSEAQPVLTSWMGCPNILRSIPLPAPTDPQDSTLEVALRNILFGEKDHLGRGDIFRCRE